MMWVYQEQAPLTIGLWRPIEVEIGFIKDYIKKSEVELKQLNNNNGTSINGNNGIKSPNNLSYRIYNNEQNIRVYGQVDTHPYNPIISTTMEDVRRHPKWGVFLCLYPTSEKRVL